ncbi:MAG: 50S ribosomal protein L18 [Candidatus Absconditabacterales bacterium]|nr:50S ribosomal protein L18 [Candidatus Absconditabacterales bacterium]
MSHLANKLKTKVKQYLKRKTRVNTKIKSHKPEYRLIMNKSNLYISAQLIDQNGNVLLFANDKKSSGKTKTERAFSAGEQLGKEIVSKKIEHIAFDRNGYLYHGRIKAFAEGVRKAGVKL